MAIHHTLQIEHSTKIERHPHTIHANHQKLYLRSPVSPGPLFHLRRAGAAAASPAVVEVYDGGDAARSEQFGRRRKGLRDAVPVDKVDVKVSLERWQKQHGSSSIKRPLSLLVSGLG